MLHNHHAKMMEAMLNLTACFWVAGFSNYGFVHFVFYMQDLAAGYASCSTCSSCRISMDLSCDSVSHNFGWRGWLKTVWLVVNWRETARATSCLCLISEVIGRKPAFTHFPCVLLVSMSFLIGDQPHYFHSMQLHYNKA